jgi:hypothetical protein
MLNIFAKHLLVATALAPMLGAVAVNRAAHGETWISWVLVALGLVLACFSLLALVAKTGEKHRLVVVSIEDKDKEVLAFLLTYLLPFIASEKLEFTGEWLTGIYILAIILISAAHANAVHFNPVMGLYYHFYAIKDANGMPALLISRPPLTKAGGDLQTVRVAHGIYLRVPQ